MKQTTTYLLLICLVSAMGGLLFGYDWVVIGGAKIFYEPFFNLESSAALRGWAMSSALIGCLMGALFSGAWSDRYGRKKMLIAASFLLSLRPLGPGRWTVFSGLSSTVLSEDSGSVLHRTSLRFILRKFLPHPSAASLFRSTS